jgi:hypothetical protein
LAPPNFKPEFVKPKASYTGSFYVDSDGTPHLEINENTAYVNHTAATLLAVDVHEDAGHGAHALNVMAGIADGRINPAVGLTDCQSSGVIHQELVAQAIEQRVLREHDGYIYEFEAAKEVLRQMVWHDAHMDLINGKNEGEVIKDFLRDMPFEPTRKVRNLVNMLINDPVFRAYGLSYWPALEMAESLIAGPTERFQRIMPKLLSGIYTPARVQRIVSSV